MARSCSCSGPRGGRRSGVVLDGAHTEGVGHLPVGASQLRFESGLVTPPPVAFCRIMDTGSHQVLGFTPIAAHGFADVRRCSVSAHSAAFEALGCCGARVGVGVGCEHCQRPGRRGWIRCGVLGRFEGQDSGEPSGRCGRVGGDLVLGAVICGEAGEGAQWCGRIAHHVVRCRRASGSVAAARGLRSPRPGGLAQYQPPTEVRVNRSHHDQPQPTD